MGYTTVNLSANTLYPVRAWKKYINTNNTEECLTSLFAADITQITYQPSERRDGYNIYFAGDHSFRNGDQITVTGVNPFAAFNVTNANVRVLTEDSISVDIPTTNPMHGSSVQADATSFTNCLLKAVVYAHRADIYGLKDTRTSNVADVYVGPDDPQVGSSALLAPGESLRFEATPGGRLRLSDLNIYGTSTDGAIIYFH